MLVQPDLHQQGTRIASPPRQPHDGLNVTSSVKLRRRNNRSNLDLAEKKRNRYSGGDFLVGSPTSRNHQQHEQPPNRGHEVMRKSGDWSYVSFPSHTKSPPVTPKMTPKMRPLSLMQQQTSRLTQQQQPVSLLESKVIASIIHNEANARGRHGGHKMSASAHSTPVAMQKLKGLQGETDYSSLGNDIRNGGHLRPFLEADSDVITSSSSAEEYTKLLRRRMISEVLLSKQPAPNVDIWNPTNNSERNSRDSSTKKSHNRRSQSAQGRNHLNKLNSTETQSEVWCKKDPVVVVVNNNNQKQKQTKPGLGRRSATQLELSRRKRPEDEIGELQKSKWKSQENLEPVSQS
jgi:hypothetical protein